MSQLLTSPEQKLRIYEIALEMKEEKLSAHFIVEVVELASHYEGAYDLLELWSTEEDHDEKQNLIAALQEELDEYKTQPKEPTKKIFISDEHFEKILKNVKEFKSHLKALVDQWGGVSKLAKITGIPQPSLSRFFNTDTPPRRTTLYRIATTLKVTESELFF